MSVPYVCAACRLGLRRRSSSLAALRNRPRPRLSHDAAGAGGRPALAWRASSSQAREPDLAGQEAETLATGTAAASRYPQNGGNQSTRKLFNSPHTRPTASHGQLGIAARRGLHVLDAAPLSRPAQATDSDALDAPPQSSVLRPLGTSTKKFVTDLTGQAHGALMRHDINGLERAWSSLVKSKAAESASLDSLEELYLVFLIGFTRTRRPIQAVTVWNHMTEHGVPPTIRTWDCMLRGFGELKDTVGVSRIWRMLNASKLPIDARVWTSYIHASCQARSAHHGFTALEEMMKNWLRAVQQNPALRAQATADMASVGDAGPHPKPTLDVFNAVIPFLARGREHRAVRQALQWACDLGLKLDAYTFNPMIQLALMSRNHDKVEAVLAEMSEFGVEPDIATFTMFLVNIFRGESPDGSETAQTRQEKADRLLAHMDSIKLKPSLLTYGAHIDGLLKGADVDNPSGFEAARTLLMHMKRQKQARSSAIYTAFIDYFFRRGDVEEVHKWWLNAAHDRSFQLDYMFFNQLTFGFAAAGDIGRMKIAIASMGKKRQSPGWHVLAEVCLALARAGDWAALQTTVDSIVAEEQLGESLRNPAGLEPFLHKLADAGLDVGWARGLVAAREQREGDSMAAEMNESPA